MTPGTTRAPSNTDKNHGNTEQVRTRSAAYRKRYAELATQGRYPYNELFTRLVPDIETPDEDTATYLLELMRSLEEAKDKIVAFGGRRVTSLAPGEVVRGDIAYFGYHLDGSGWIVFEDAQIVGTDRGDAALTVNGRRDPSCYVSLERILVR